MDVFILDLSSVQINGECRLEGYKNMIEALSYHQGETGKSGQVFTITKYVDLSSVQLIDYCNQAKNIPTIVFTVGNNDNGKITRLATYTLTNSLISSVSVGGGRGGKPEETVTFNCTRISRS